MKFKIGKPNNFGKNLILVRTTEMKNLKYDILVAGSDQLWNPNRTYGKLDSAFLLQFGNCEKKIYCC